MEKKVAGFWVKVPCLDNLGSCTYDNVCGTWAEACPKYFAKYGLPCTCPIPPNTYTLTDVTEFDSQKLPPGSAGDIRITANLVSKTSGAFTCLQLLLTIA